MINKYNNNDITQVTKYNNMVITYDKLNNRYLVWSYNNHIATISDFKIELNTNYFNYSVTTSRHFTKSLGKILVYQLKSLQTILLGYHAIKRWLQVTPSNIPNYKTKLESFIMSLNHMYKTDIYSNTWVIIYSGNCQDINNPTL